VSDKILKDFIVEMVKAGPDYMKKENIRSAIQDVIIDLVSKGEIQSDAELKNFFGTADMSLKALKMVPFNTYEKLAGKK
jgi:hypothetical protein